MTIQTNWSLEKRKMKLEALQLKDLLDWRQNIQNTACKLTPRVIKLTGWRSNFLRFWKNMHAIKIFNSFTLIFLYQTTWSSRLSNTATKPTAVTVLVSETVSVTVVLQVQSWKGLGKGVTIWPLPLWFF